jgi:transposase InsO family protein
VREYLAAKKLPEWPTLRKDVEEYRRRCPICQRLDIRRPHIETAPYLLSTRDKAMRHLAIDTLGPFPPDAQGNTYIIVIIDCFSRFVQLTAAADATAEAAAQAIKKHFSFFGVPHTIRSDNGSQYANSTLQHISRLTGIRFDKTIAYSHEENGLVERAHREILYHLRSILYEKRTRDEWSDACPMVMRLMNCQKHSATGLTPAQIITPLVDSRNGLLYSHTSVDNPDFDPELLSDNLLQLQQHLEQLVRAAFAKHTLIVADDSGLPDLTTYDVDSLVLLTQPKGDRPTTKLDSLWRGPFTVTAAAGPRYSIRHLATGVLQDVHISRLKAYIHDPDMGMTALEVACQDNDSHIVESILGHDGTARDRINLRFLVHWAGYSSEHDSWEPYSALRHNESLHTYLREHKMKTLIPTTHK